MASFNLETAILRDGRLMVPFDDTSFDELLGGDQLTVVQVRSTQALLDIRIGHCYIPNSVKGSFQL